MRGSVFGTIDFENTSGTRYDCAAFGWRVCLLLTTSTWAVVIISGGLVRNCTYTGCPVISNTTTKMGTLETKTNRKGGIIFFTEASVFDKIKFENSQSSTQATRNR